MVAKVVAQGDHRLLTFEHPVHRQPFAAGQHRPQLRHVGQREEHVEGMRHHRQRAWCALGPQLLRQRQGERDAGRDPNLAKERPVSEVEGYLQ